MLFWRENFDQGVQFVWKRKTFWHYKLFPTQSGVFRHTSAPFKTDDNNIFVNKTGKLIAKKVAVLGT